MLVIGGGGREHAIVWKLAASPLVKKIYTAPGNPGTAAHGENVPIAVDDIAGLVDFAKREAVDLTVVGPELPLTLGVADAFRAEGLRIFGPTKAAAALEGSKAFSKALMTKYGLPTARYREFTDPDEALRYAEGAGGPVVIKADGLAAGKGVLICSTVDEMIVAVDSLMKKKVFGEAGERVIVEDFLVGEEASFIAVTDGRCVVPLAPSQDHKAIYDGDEGPNTGGMGAYSPAPVVTAELEREIMERIMVPAVRAMEEEGRPYSGVLYAGLMMTDEGPMLLEFNCRFGDPEAQPLMARLEDDLAELLMACAEGGLEERTLSWSEKTAVCVVMASEGYPGEYEKGKPISGLEEAAAMEDVVVFHAGTAEEDGRIVTAGGRVLGVTGLGADTKEAIEHTYRAVEKISWDGAYYRRDIGLKALGR